jgi:hypothetical protein
LRPRASIDADPDPRFAPVFNRIAARCGPLWHVSHAPGPGEQAILN